MKKIFTLAAGLLMTVLVFAADRRPTVTVNSSKNYKIVIDGRSYFGSNTSINLSNLYDGRHSIQVFEMRGSVYSRRQPVERMIGSSSFFLNRKDVIINIDYFGNISIREMKNRFDRNDRGWNDRDDRDWNDRDGRDRDGDGRDRDRGRF